MSIPAPAVYSTEDPEAMTAKRRTRNGWESPRVGFWLDNKISLVAVRPSK